MHEHGQAISLADLRQLQGERYVTFGRYSCAPCKALKEALLAHADLFLGMPVAFCNLPPSKAAALIASGELRGFPAVSIVKDGLIIAEMTGVPAGDETDICRSVLQFLEQAGSGR